MRTVESVVNFEGEGYLCQRTDRVLPKKGCTVKLYHYDELAGKVLIESDIDAIEALNNFIEEHKNSRRPTYMVLHAEDSVVELPSSSSSSSKTIPRKVMLPHLIRLPSVCLTF